MTDSRLVMRLLVEGVEKQRLEADFSFISLVHMQIIGLPKVTGKNHINPEAIRDVEEAYRIFENIHATEYKDKLVRIELNYS